MAQERADPVKAVIVVDVNKLSLEMRSGKNLLFSIRKQEDGHCGIQILYIYKARSSLPLKKHEHMTILLCLALRVSSPSTLSPQIEILLWRSLFNPLEFCRSERDCRRLCLLDSYHQECLKLPDSQLFTLQSRA
jgi:hypothetical protein